MYPHLILFKLLMNAAIQFGIIHIKLYGILSHNRIRKQEREEINIVSPDIQKPADIIQRCDNMGICPVLFHGLAHTEQFRFRTLAGVFLLQEKCRFVGKGRPLLPDSVNQINGILDADLFLRQLFFIFLSFLHREYTSVKGDRPALRNASAQIFRNRRRLSHEHLHQPDTAAFQFILCLEEISPVRPQPSVVSGNDYRSVRTAESGNILSCLKMFPHIFTLVKVCSRHNIGVNPFFCHKRPKRNNPFCYVHK